MKNKIITSIVVAISLLTTTGCSAGIQKKYTKEQLINLIAETQSIKENSHIMAESARTLGWKDDDKIIKEIQQKWNKANEEQQSYQQLLDTILFEEAEAVRKQKEAEELARKAEEAKWEAKAAEYPAATQIWRFMKAQGWNDYVCAGILGNIMAEVGGQTLNIRYTLSSSGYYGMCQWSRTYSQVWGAGLEKQCEFLRDTIKYEFDTYGFKYQKGFKFSSFLALTNAQQAALAFAKSYERCASGSYKIRQQNAEKAYQYFVN